MTNGSIGSVAGTTFGILGMGIGLGVLAHTAKNVTRMTDDMYGRPRRRSQRPRSYYSPRMKSPRMRINQSYRPKTRSYSRRPSYKWNY